MCRVSTQIDDCQINFNLRDDFQLMTSVDELSCNGIVFLRHMPDFQCALLTGVNLRMGYAHALFNF